MKTQNPLLLFDGECTMCNFWVQFIKKRNPKKSIDFLPLQSEKGNLILFKYKIDSSVDSIVFVWNNKAYIKSSAALQIINQLGLWWKILLIFWLIPKPIRDWGYDVIARNRHRFFATKGECDLH